MGHMQQYRDFASRWTQELIAASLVEYAPERKCSITGRFVQAVRVPGGAN